VNGKGGVPKGDAGGVGKGKLAENCRQAVSLSSKKKVSYPINCLEAKNWGVDLRAYHANIVMKLKAQQAQLFEST